MKKLFSFKSSSSNNGTKNSSSPSADKQIYWDVPSESELYDKERDKAKNGYRGPKGLLSKSRKSYDNETTGATSFLRRSLSMSSAAFLDDELGGSDISSRLDLSRSPCSSVSSVAEQYEPRRQLKAKQFDVESNRNACGPDRPCSSKSYPDSSESSSSSNASTKVVDRYIDGEEQPRKSRPKNNTHQRDAARDGKFGGRCPPRVQHTAPGSGIDNRSKSHSFREFKGSRLYPSSRDRVDPPRVQHTAPGSPTDGIDNRSKSHSFRGFKGSCLYPSSRDRVENGFDHEFPRRLARNVIKRLSQTHSLNKSSLKEFNHDVPITVEDIYHDKVDKCFGPNLESRSLKSFELEKTYGTIDKYHGDDFLASQNQRCFSGSNFEETDSFQAEDAVEMELQQRYKEAQEMVLLLSEELEQDSFLRGSGFDFPGLIQTIKKLTEEKLSLAVEVSDLLMSNISERESSKGKFNLVKSDLESRVQRLGKEKRELQLAFEKELDRRSSNWSFKCNKYQLEEKRLRERVRELAEQNVSLQREVSSLSERETERESAVMCSEQQLRHLTSIVEEASKENKDLRENLFELEKRYFEAEENLNCFKKNFREKDNECKMLQKSICELLRTCGEQQKTIEGLREEFSEEFEKQSVDNFDKHVKKFQMEQMRLTGVELSLRRKVESQRIEIDSLRHENIYFLNRLKGCGEEIGVLNFKLDEEMRSRICYLQNQGLPLLKESTQLCSQLLDFIKEEAGQMSASKQGTILKRNGLDGQFAVEADVKVKGFKRGFENLTRSLQTVSSVLQEKCNSIASEFELCNIGDGSRKPSDLTSEETLRYQLKAETLVTSLLREKLYSMESEVEQLHAEVAAAMRGNGILRCEVQNTMDNVSRASHKLKDYEVQMQKKDETMNRLENEIEELTKELTFTKGILPKVSGERDLMFEKVNQANEENMVLNSEVRFLKKKIEALDEDILVKEGQITILKDTLATKPFDLLAVGDYTEDFLLK